MPINEMFCCGKCAFCAEGRVRDRKAKRGAFADGHVCTIRPPVANGYQAATDPARVCALFTDRETGAQPLRHALPEPVQPATVAENGGRTDE